MVNPNALIVVRHPGKLTGDAVAEIHKLISSQVEGASVLVLPDHLAVEVHGI
jgi:hypothetical protein